MAVGAGVVDREGDEGPAVMSADVAAVPHVEEVVEGLPGKPEGDGIESLVVLESQPLPPLETFAAAAWAREHSSQRQRRLV
jgi:hypothetical protein